jgi:hypothetical protein
MIFGGTYENSGWREHDTKMGCTHESHWGPKLCKVVNSGVGLHQNARGERTQMGREIMWEIPVKADQRQHGTPPEF